MLVKCWLDLRNNVSSILLWKSDLNYNNLEYWTLQIFQNITIWKVWKTKPNIFYQQKEIFFLAGLSWIPKGSLFKRGNRVPLCTPSTSCVDWQHGWNGYRLYGLHERKVPEGHVPLSASTWPPAGKGQGSTAVCHRSTGMNTINAGVSPSLNPH